ncbi:hypothetical protein IID19_00790 [Patescibacteria group bacterium]|nr:hypothetical protein [Patescibacteria group bacterium]
MEEGVNNTEKMEGMCEHGNFVASCVQCNKVDAEQKPDSLDSKESEKRPEKLYRAFTVHPDELTVDRLREKLVPGVVNKDDPTKINDGNELGVYMSTNSRMVETAYARGGGGGTSHVDVPKYDDRGAYSTRVNLPNVAIMLEVDTQGLDIRKPVITDYLKLVENNGFEGAEWIADDIKEQFYRVQKLILSRWANDKEKFVVTLDDDSDEALQIAIDTVQEEFAKRKAEAEEFGRMLEALSENQRMTDYGVKIGWEKWKTEKVENSDKK